MDFFFTEASLDSIKFIDPEYVAFLSVKEGKYNNVKEFLFRGNKISTETSLLKITRLNNYESFNPSILSQSENRLLKRSYIKNCRVIMLDHEKILIDIEEDKMTYFSGLFGYNNSLKGSDRLSGFLQLEFQNLFGSDRSLALFWQKLNSNRDLIELFYHESGPLQIPLSGDLLFSREEVDSTYISSKFSTDIYYFTLTSKYGLSFSLNNIFPGSRRPKLISANNLTNIGLFWEYSNLVNNLNPVSGNNIRIGYYNIFYKFDSKKDSRQQSELFWQVLINPLLKSVISISANIKALENKDLMDYELFTLGGINDLRGYNEDQFKGHLVFWSNLEYRYLLSFNSRAFIFFDYGFVQSPERKFGKLFSTGLGLRLNTKLGLIGIDYGIGYENEKFRNPLDGIIHFGLETKI